VFGPVYFMPFSDFQKSDHVLPVRYFLSSLAAPQRSSIFMNNDVYEYVSKVLRSERR
jgi:hypothetical protein